MKPAVVVTTVFLAFVAVIHLLRLVFQVEVLVGGATVPMWASIVAVIGPGALALWLWREQRSV